MSINISPVNIVAIALTNKIFSQKIKSPKKGKGSYNRKRIDPIKI